MTGKGASRYATAKVENFEGVEANPGRIGVGSRIMLTSNQCGWADANLANGTMGVVKEIIFHPHKNSELPHLLYVQWDDTYKGPGIDYLCPKTGVYLPRVTNLSPVKKVHILRKGVEREGYCIKLCWAIGVGKCQGLTIGAVVIHMGRDQRTVDPQAEFIMCSRCKMAGARDYGGIFARQVEFHVLVNQRQNEHRRKADYASREQ